MTVNALNTHTFFNKYIIETQSPELTAKDRRIALVASIIFGILTAGIGHLVIYLNNYLKQKKIQQIAQTASSIPNTTSIPAVNAVLPPAVPQSFRQSLYAKSVQEACNPKFTLTSWNLEQMNQWHHKTEPEKQKYFRGWYDRLSPEKQRKYFPSGLESDEEFGKAFQNITDTSKLIRWNMTDGDPSSLGVIFYTVGLNDEFKELFKDLFSLINIRIDSPIDRLLFFPLSLLSDGKTLKFFSTVEECNAASKRYWSKDWEESLVMSAAEFDVVKRYFDNRIQTLDKAINLSARFHELGLHKPRGADELTLKELDTHWIPCKNTITEKTNCRMFRLRFDLSTPSELATTTLFETFEMNSYEMTNLLKCFSEICQSASKQPLPANPIEIPLNQIPFLTAEEIGRFQKRARILLFLNDKQLSSLGLDDDKFNHMIGLTKYIYSDTVVETWAQTLSLAQKDRVEKCLVSIRNQNRHK